MVMFSFAQINWALAEVPVFTTLFAWMCLILSNNVAARVKKLQSLDNITTYFLFQSAKLSLF